MIPILMLTHNRLSFTKKAIASVLLSTKVPFQLFIFDNGSTDGTVEYLQSLDGDPRIRVEFSETNQGIQGGMDRFHAAYPGAKHYAKVDNDTLVPPGWLRELKYIIGKHNAELVGSIHHTFTEGCLQAMNKAQVEGFAPYPTPGGSGILYSAKFVKGIRIADYAKGLQDGWIRFCGTRKKSVRGFSSVKIELLDMNDHYWRKGQSPQPHPASNKIAIIQRRADTMPGRKVLKFLGHPVIGDRYEGDDHAVAVRAVKGQVFEVSEEKARQLLADFPDAFRDATGLQPEMPKAAKEPEKKPEVEAKILTPKPTVRKIKRTPDGKPVTMKIFRFGAKKREKKEVDKHGRKSKTA